MSERTKTPLTPVAQKFILHWGEMCTRWGINRTVAQVHALLFLSPQPVPADEIAATLAEARPHVSTSPREPHGWCIDRVGRVRCGRHLYQRGRESGAPRAQGARREYHHDFTHVRIHRAKRKARARLAVF